MFSLQDAEHPQHRDRRRVRRLPGHRQGRFATTWSSSASTRSAPSTRSTGRGCWRRWCTTSPATSRPRRRTTRQVSFTVPSGNFGNICAGHVARMMGLPIDKLVLATNENDVLDEFFRTGVYRVRCGADTHETSSPSMDISKASNFERFVFDLLGRDGARMAQLFGERARDARPLRPERRPGVRAGRRSATVSPAARAPMPTASPPSATPDERFGVDDRHPYGRRPEGRARAPASPACR